MCKNYEMTTITSEYTINKVKNRRTYFGMVSLTVELTQTGKLEIEEQFSEKQLSSFSQGQIIAIPKQGFDSWKAGIHKGIEYAYSKIEHKKGVKIIIDSAQGLPTDTNPTIIGMAACKAILEKLPNSVSQHELEQLEAFVFSSWNYEPIDSIPDFAEKTIIGKKLRN